MHLHWILRRVLLITIGTVFVFCVVYFLGPLYYSAHQEPVVIIERATDCDDIAYGTPSGVQTLELGDRNVSVLCEIGADGRWTVALRRDVRLPEQDFERNWTDYKLGFGSLAGAFWLGNEWLHRLTSRRGWRYELRVELRDAEGAALHAHYLGFRVGPEWDEYRLHLGAYSGTAGDSLSFVNKMPFSTAERDNDEHPTHNCAEYDGPFWHRNCGLTYLTIKHVYNMHWIRKTATANIFLHRAVMKIRPYKRPKYRHRGPLLRGNSTRWSLDWVFD